MFHWICPECGREIPPAVRECPACDPSSVQAGSVAPEPEPAPLQSAPAPAPLPDPLLGLVQKLREVQRDQGLAAASAATHSSPEPAPQPPSPSEPAAAEPAAAEPVAAEPPSPTPAPQLLLESGLAPIALLAPPEPATQPKPAQGRLGPPDPEELEAVPPSLAPLSDAPLYQQVQVIAPADPATAGRVPTPDLRPMPSPPAPAPDPASLELAVPSAAPTGTAFSQPSLIAASSPGSPMLALAALQDVSMIASRIRLASSATQILRPDAGPCITLPGPALPRALNSLQDAGISRILVDRPKAARTGSRGWLAGVVVAAVLLAGFLALDLYDAPGTAAEPKPAPPPEVAVVAAPAPAVSTPVPALSPAASYSLTKAIEVTGFRFVGDKQEVRYVVVNHSAAELGAVTVYVTLRSSAAKPGQPPLYRFSFRAPALGPFESREMAATPDKGPDKLAHSAGDWQSLHADIELGQ
jgi:hypothetical protein